MKQSQMDEALNRVAAHTSLEFMRDNLEKIRHCVATGVPIIIKDGELVDVSSPIYVDFTYITHQGREWTGTIEIKRGNDIQSVVEETLLTYYNIAPSGKLGGEITVYIYSDKERTHLLDTGLWIKTDKEDFKLITGRQHD